MNAIHYTISWIIRLVTAFLCRIDAGDLRKIPKHGPCIIVTNHINFLEVPILYTRLMPRRLASLVKAETWNNPLLGFLGDLWNAIPISRGVVDRQAINAARKVLEQGDMLVIAPEGARSGDGKLRKGNPGVILLAADSGVPVIPVAHHGGELFWKNLKSFKRTSFFVKVGSPYVVSSGDEAIDRMTRKKMIDEVMLTIAELLPECLRGYYAEAIPPSGSRYLEFA